MTTLKMHTPNLVDSNIERLAALFPNCVTEKPKTDEQGKVIRDMNGEVVLERGIDFELLKQELSHSVIDGSQERYRLDWVGKREAIVTANSPIAKTLRPCRDESVDFETTGNLFIEGDNLEALKLLQESYLGKVKMIYIDPPYNTGNDFIYNDDFAADTAEFFERSGQVDADGNRLVANTESNGRFHSDWLSMMYSRLKLARNLLSDDGVIFISIGVEEIANLKKITDEVFGSANFIEIFSWVKTSTPPALSKKSRKTNEYILCYEKSRNIFEYNGELLDGGDQPLLNTGNAVGELTIPKEVMKFNFIENGNLKAGMYDRVELLNDLTIINHYALNDIKVKGEFKWTQIFLNSEVIAGTTFVVKTDKLSIRFIRSGEGYKRPTNFIKEKYTTPLIDKKYKEVGTNENASTEVKNLMDDDVFSYPKPISLMEHLIGFIIKDGDIVMDFFAGSGTTAEGVFSYCLKNQIQVNFILVQLPESLEIQLEKVSDTNLKRIIQNGINFLSKNKKPLFLSELTKERIRRAGQKIKADNADKDLNHLDTGFRVLKIDTSNMNDIYYRPQDYNQDLLATLENNIKEDRSDEDLLFQFMLDTGVPLSLPIERTQLPSKSGGHTIYQVGGNSLIASLDYIDANMVNDIAALNPLKFITSERAIATDSDKTNIKERFKQLSPHTDVRFI